ncbi:MULTISPECIES: XRE family transcriptional regulator [Pseudomonas]|uniref:XRE family transcriptional regulator n=1 Tax=Pseudomonas TaxID=286 RepID=UPI001B3422A0|nr:MULTISPECIES: XRE family transcriptional regulator [Pseudomonas]MBP5970298.1 XRE family transcriptional regulator [Pseudomonas iridis]UHC81027.1 XRE family transcriptional regulator [Pseudomonas sp. NIBR-H-19]
MKEHHPGFQRFSSVWDALEDTPQDAARMRLRARLMRTLCENSIVKTSSKEAAKHVDITQPRLKDVPNGEIDTVSSGELAYLAMHKA